MRARSRSSRRSWRGRQPVAGRGERGAADVEEPLGPLQHGPVADRDQRGALACQPALDGAARAVEQPGGVAAERLGVGHDQPRGMRGRRCAHVGDQVGERRVLLVADRGDDRRRARGDGAAERLVGERPRDPRAIRRRAPARSRRPRRAGRAARRRAPARAVQRPPCTAHSTISNRAEGNRRRAFSTTSCLAAASRPQTRPMRRGKRGRGCLRSAANRPSAASAVLSRSSRASRSPRPRRATAWTRSDSSPVRVNSSGRPCTCTRSPSCSGGSMRSYWVRGIAHLHGRAALEILQRPEDERPAGLAAQLGDLALDPDVRETADPAGESLVEGRDGVDVTVAMARRDRTLWRGQGFVPREGSARRSRACSLA